MDDSEEQQQEAQTSAKIHYKDFLYITSVVASVGVALAVSTAHSLASTVTYHGRSDAATLAAVNRSATWYTWSASVYALGLIFSLPGQVLETSPNFVKIYKSKQHKTWLRLTFKFMAWASLGLVAAGTALVGEGLKINSPRAGQMIQWTLLGVGSSNCGAWILLRYQPLKAIGQILGGGKSKRKSVQSDSDPEEAHMT